MTILALEFSSPQRSVAVSRDGVVLAEAVETGGRNAAAFGMIEKILYESEIKREYIDVLCIGLGPGSYTGIRLAIAIAQGWQLARGTKLAGVGSTGAIAAQAWEEMLFGRVNVVVDAQRDEFYVGAYEISAGGWRETAPLRIVSLAEVQSSADAGEILAGPEVTRWFRTGRVVFPRASLLGKLAGSRVDFVAGENLEPVYLRETNFVKAPPGKNHL
jgi:tRNA threonylcarbamoyladenosine biosynthesis protein TsaB